VPTDLVIGLAGLVLIGLLGVRVVPDQEKLAVLRLGRFIGTRGPGVVWILPFVDKAIRMNLDRDVPEWRSLSTEQLTSEIERRVSMSGLWR
jgi:regulator of protease activity HflC (stomatin/prohibitin superfamily)